MINLTFFSKRFELNINFSNQIYSNYNMEVLLHLLYINKNLAPNHLKKSILILFFALVNED